jgi:hypothetical protein
MKQKLFLALTLVALFFSSCISYENLPTQMGRLDLTYRSRANAIRQERLAIDRVNGDTLAKNVPSHLNRWQERRYARALNAGRQEQVIDRLAQEDISDLLDKQGRLKGIIANDYCVVVAFKFCPLDGGEKRTFFVARGGKQEVFLSPGKYLLSTFDGGRQLGCSITISVDLQRDAFLGKEYSFVAYQPRR